MSELQRLPSHISHDREMSFCVGAPKGKKVDARLVLTVEGCTCQIDDLELALHQLLAKFQVRNDPATIGDCGCG